MKKIIAFFIILSIAFSFVSCNIDVSNIGKSGSINGVAVKNFVIVYDKEGLDYNQRAAEYIQSEILARTGNELQIVDDSTPAASNEIVVGETSRDISKALQAECKGLEFAIMAKDGSVAL
ncbi:MAG: hypothetical protein IKU99_05045, partial [Clostridia bacterium]|nr:hypothetical protein [Clostridia bacterium]